MKRVVLRDAHFSPESFPRLSLLSLFHFCLSKEGQDRYYMYLVFFKLKPFIIHSPHVYLLLLASAYIPDTAAALTVRLWWKLSWWIGSFHISYIKLTCLLQNLGSSCSIIILPWTLVGPLSFCSGIFNDFLLVLEKLGVVSKLLVVSVLRLSFNLLAVTTISTTALLLHIRHRFISKNN